ncbi:hypothetical protein ACFCZ1_26165 [Streptomyces sp. NPDC056224]|uniref:hypothetical protein n=1 Tax=Streptomyces sp. NPDC056224 TaxID=3345750 RepID=UPI0035DF9EF9
MAARLGVTHWPSRLLGRELGLSFSAVQGVAKVCTQPHRVQTFKFSTDPELESKIRDIVGLCPAPPEKAVVVCVDEETQIQALDQTALPAVDDMGVVPLACGAEGVQGKTCGFWNLNAQVSAPRARILFPGVP